MMEELGTVLGVLSAWALISVALSIMIGRALKQFDRPPRPDENEGTSK